MNNIKELKKIQIVNVLKRLNIDADEKKKDEFWFRAPWRNERTASVKCKDNLFYDFGDNSYKGNTIDFIMMMLSINFIEAVEWLQNESVIFSFHQTTFKRLPIEKEKAYEITAIKPLMNSHLIEYIQSRSIDLRIVKKYCIELHYSLNGKSYYGIGFLNGLDGYEVRNKYVKICLGTKAPTYFSNGSNRIILFESWSDFLSFVTLYPKAEERYDYLILNSVGILNNILINKTNTYLYKRTNVKLDKCKNVQMNNCTKNTLYKELKYVSIICCFDNDNAGNTATKKVVNAFPNLVKDGRALYQDYKDLNDFLTTKSGR